MPRNVRNFWLNAEVDGRATDIATGPRRKDGGMYLNLYVRNEGDIERLLTIECTVDTLDPAKLIVKLSGPPVFTNEDTFVRIERKR